MIDPELIIAAASECLRTPFRHQARVPGLGIDCAGLLVHCFKALDLPFNDELGYPRSPYDGMLEKILDAQPSLVRINKRDAQPGDWLVMRIKTAPQHIALYSGNRHGYPYIIHASSEHGEVVNHRLDELWRPRVVCAYRMERPA